MLEPDTPVLTHVLLTPPWVQPVVRPTLLAVWPTMAVPSPVMVNAPAISSEPLFAPVVLAIAPSVKLGEGFAKLLKLASDQRHFFPLAHLENAGSAVSVPINSSGIWFSGW